jgi:D-aspartate ligase
MDQRPMHVEHRGSRQSCAPAIVLACSGADEGPLNVVRALGENGIPSILVAESRRTPAEASRFVMRTVFVPELTTRSGALVSAVRQIAQNQRSRPVLFPTADPDLLMASRMAAELDSCCHLIAPPHQIVSALSDKACFADLARRLNLDVPQTVVPTSDSSFLALASTLRLPVVVKPSKPQSWQRAEIRLIVGNAKAVLVTSMRELETLYTGIAEFTHDMVLQEYVPGGDPEHFDVHTYFDRASRPVAWFCGQKLRIYPPHAGSGCFVVSRYEESVVQLALASLQRIGYSGIANLNFKRNPKTNEFRLLEINPRVSQWNILASRCGVNLPYLAYQDANGIAIAPRQPQTDNVHYMNFPNDHRAFRIYRREGEVTTLQYVRSLLRRPMVFQVFDWKDPGPFFNQFTKVFWGRLRRLLGRGVGS